MLGCFNALVEWWAACNHAALPAPWI